MERLSGFGLTNSTDSSKETHDTRDMLARNRLANVSFFVCSCGEIVVLAILCGILARIVNDPSDEHNTKAFAIVCAYSAAVWIVCAIPWLVWEQYRPGHKLPPNTTYITAGVLSLIHI